MGIDTTGAAAAVDGAMRAERAKLVGLCPHLTGDADAAEDLAQEALYEAIRSERKLRDAGKRAEWLSGIARNVCLRWARRRARESTRLVRLLSEDSAPLAPDGCVADNFDLEVELERDELAELLDRALALLPPETRAILIERYVRESPYAEMAARLGLTEDAVAKRLERGKLALRRVLTTELSAEAAAYGLSATGGGWQETRIWCPMCGRRRLLGRFDRREGRFGLCCPGCGTKERDTLFDTHVTGVLGELKTYRPAVSRLMEWAYTYYRGALVDGAAPCIACGRPAVLVLGMPPETPAPIRNAHGIHLRCANCGLVSRVTLSGLARHLPDARRFWREHPRVCTVPERTVEVNGRAALVTRFESVTETARLDVISACDTFEVLGVHPTSRE